MATNTASRRKKIPSMLNGMPIAPPNFPMSPGQSRPISQEGVGDSSARCLLGIAPGRRHAPSGLVQVTDLIGDLDLSFEAMELPGEP